MARHVSRVADARHRVQRPEAIASKFTPKVDLKVELIKDFSADYPAPFWDTFPTNKVSHWNPESYMDADAWISLATELKYPCMSNIQWIARGIREGFAVGCRGTGRWPMMSPNHKTAVVHGKQLVDTMATWMIKKLAAGPYTLSELPWTEDIIKQSPISVALKPSGE